LFVVPSDVWDVSARYCGCEGTDGDEVIFTLACNIRATLFNVVPQIFTVNLDVCITRGVRGAQKVYEFHEQISGEKEEGGGEYQPNHSVFIPKSL
jgi:hypothetical protein